MPRGRKKTSAPQTPSQGNVQNVNLNPDIIRYLAYYGLLNEANSNNPSVLADKIRQRLNPEILRNSVATIVNQNYGTKY
jgi:hypothetical protein